MCANLSRGLSRGVACILALSVAVSVLSLAVTWVLLLLISALDRRRAGKDDA